VVLVLVGEVDRIDGTEGREVEAAGDREHEVHAGAFRPAADLVHQQRVDQEAGRGGLDAPSLPSQVRQP
jgi:hypothetical protein